MSRELDAIIKRGLGESFLGTLNIKKRPKTAYESAIEAKINSLREENKRLKRTINEVVKYDMARKKR